MYKPFEVTAGLGDEFIGSDDITYLEIDVADVKGCAGCGSDNPDHVHTFDPVDVDFENNLGNGNNGNFSTALVTPELFMDGDIAADTSTTARIEVNGALTSQIDEAFDDDWIAIDLTEGVTYTFYMIRSGDSALNDPYLYLHNADGIEIAQNDDLLGPDGDAVSRNSGITFTADATATYYLVATDFSAFSGGYTLYANEGNFRPTVELDTQVDFLVNGFDNRSAWATNTITYDVSALSAAEAALAVAAMQLWADVTPLNFVEVTGGQNAALDFVNDEDGAFARTPSPGGVISSSEINVSLVDWIGTYGDQFNSYSFQTYIHEVGHALGLGHGGPYNGSANFGVDNIFANDLWQYTVMSYNDQGEGLGNNVGTPRLVLGLQTADILAIQALYGVNPNGTREGATVYGFNSTAGGMFDFGAFENNPTSVQNDAAGAIRPPSLAIYDTGGYDVLDLSGYSADQRISLIPETFSDIGNNYNLGGDVALGNILSIARGTIIEVAIGGFGDDNITGNSADNVLAGRVGDDALLGLDGNDTIFGDAGNDTVSGGNGDDLIVGGIGDDILNGDGGNDILNGEDGDDNVNGNDGDDSLAGGAGNDSVTGGNGNDVVFGNLGNDTVSGDAGDDILVGEEGDDILNGDIGNDLLNGGDGNDTMNGGDGDDGLAGGDGNDILNGGAGVDGIFGGAGNDSIAGGDGVDYLYGDDGDDVIVGDAGNDQLYGGNGMDTLVGGSGADLIFGGADNDVLSGEGDDDVINGDAGDDNMAGGDGNDQLYGGEGNDVGFGGAGNDALDMGVGDDLAYGGAGNDNLFGGDGNDNLNGEDGDDILVGGAGDDLLNGGIGNDQIDAGAGADTLIGDLGNDNLFGGDGNDTVNGGDGNDVVAGQDGNDVLFGGAGNDIVAGGTGVNTMTGGSGEDIFIVDTSAMIDTITDFSVTDDVIRIRNDEAYDTFAEVQTAISSVGGNTVITFASGGTITLEGVAASSLTASNFTFVSTGGQEKLDDDTLVNTTFDDGFAFKDDIVAVSDTLSDYDDMTGLSGDQGTDISKFMTDDMYSSDNYAMAAEVNAALFGDNYWLALEENGVIDTII